MGNRFWTRRWTWSCMSFVLGFASILVWSPIPIHTQLHTILSSCRKQDNSPAYIYCFRSRIQRLLTQHGVLSVAESLESLYRQQTTIEGMTTTSCHDLAHVIGEEGVVITRDLGKTITQCGSGCSFGCVHGALLAGIRTNPDLLSNLPSVCASFANNNYPKATRVACDHGIGHGVAELTSFDVFNGLSLCDSLVEHESKKDCGRGVIMEIFDSPVLSHPAKKLPDDIGSFCATLPGVYKESCYVNAGSREYGRSFDEERATKACNSVPSAFADECMEYLGEHIYFWSARDSKKVSAFCGRIKEAEKIGCVAGLVRALAYVQDVQGAKESCGQISGIDQRLCLSLFGQRVEYLQGKNIRDKLCSQFSPDERLACANNYD